MTSEEQTITMGSGDFEDRIASLARTVGTPTPVVSVYLDTRWADEHQRDRVRIFVKNEVARAREAPGPAAAAPGDLDWVERQAAIAIGQERFPDAHGMALFACEGLGLREVLPARAPFDNEFVVAATPYLRPLVGRALDSPTAIAVFVDGESARLVPIGPAEIEEEVVLAADVPGRHSRGGWAQLAQSRYQRHIQDHRDRHFAAVLDTLIALVESHGVHWIVLAGEPRNVGIFESSLPARIAERLAGTVVAARYESTSAIAGRAAEVIARKHRQRQADDVDAVLTEAAKGGRAVAGMDRTIAAINRGAVHRLYLIKGLRAPGRVCAACGAFSRGAEAPCGFCSAATRAVELGDALADRVLAAGGRVEVVPVHGELARAGGAAASLRYPV
jgi:peptide subunit release factor 1 (eRF1)